MTKFMLGALLFLPLATVFFWQSSSCRSQNSNMNKNSTRNVNVNANAGASENANTSQNSNSSSTAGQTPAGLRGIWGGQHINIEVTESGAQINYDCAHGTIAEGIVPDGAGKFVVKGLHMPEHPGPLRESDEDGGQAASYSGTIEGQTMTLTVTLSQSNENIGTFNLTQGKSGRIRKCL